MKEESKMLERYFKILQFCSCGFFISIETHFPQEKKITTIICINITENISTTQLKEN